MSDTISIVDLSVLACIGVPEEERARPQRLLISIELRGHFHKAGMSDDLAETINYFEVCERVKALCGSSSCKLIEKLAEDLAIAILREFNPESVAVEVKKFIIPEARHISCRIERDRHAPSFFV